MRDGARAQAAIEVLEQCQNHKRPANLELKDWGLKHRFAGSKDRSAIGDIVFMALRLRAISSYMLGSDEPRAWVLGALFYGFNISKEVIIDNSHIETHAYSPLSDEEIIALKPMDENAAPWVIGNYPEWLDDDLAIIFGENRAAEMAQMSKPAPLDLRANIAKTSNDELITELSTSPKLLEPPLKTKLSPWGVRIPWKYGKNFPWAIEPSFLQGDFEVQDEASQLVALIANPKANDLIADVCAGGGGKTLALSAMTQNKAKIIAFDKDANRIAPIHERLRRVGCDNVEVRTQRRVDALADLRHKCDIVLIDAPCTGSGTWRRSPDTKWRISSQNIESRLIDQQEALNLGAPLVKKQGRLIYATCSILPQENDGAIKKFLLHNPNFSIVSIDKYLIQIGQEKLLKHTYQTDFGVQFTPLKSDTDGFYIAILEAL